MKSWKRAADDEGMTLVEIVVAMAIFFIAFTALMSLMLANSLMNVKAREKANLVNAANSYIERARQLAYFQIGAPDAPSGEPTGVLIPITLTANGFTIDITPTVTYETDPRIAALHPSTNHYKRLTLACAARIGADDDRPMTYVADAIIKRVSSDAAAMSEQANLAWTTGSPEEAGQVEGDTVEVGAIASALGDGVTLRSMNFYCDGVPLKDKYNTTAQWSLNTEALTKVFYWDTLAVNDDGVPLSLDGTHTLTIEVWDSNGKQSYSQKSVLVDNAPPDTPSGIWTTAITGDSIGLEWARSWDGINVAPFYRLAVASQGASATGTGDLTGWTIASGSPYTIPATGTVYNAQPLSRYYFYVTALGPAPLSKESTGGAACIGVSRPDISTSTWSNRWRGKGTKTSPLQVWPTVVINISKPTFPYDAATVKNYVYRATTVAGLDTAVPTELGDMWTVTYSATNWLTSVPQHYYRVKTVVTPLGYEGGTPVTVESQIIGPNPADGQPGSSGAEQTTSGTMPEVTWWW